ncbi:molecular chaperone Hsp20 [Halobacteriales archaeon QS_1_68_17]|nr:MAG: molecular chaperone Hsp20 [Halobacteriales archaeon QS_1_68_17]
MIRELGRSLGNAVLEQVGRTSSRIQERKPLPVDLLESDEAHLAVFDAPGATSSDIQVRFVDGEIQVRIDRFRDFYEEHEMRLPGRGLSLDGSVALPDGAAADPEAATATLASNGTLRVRVPKRDEATGAAATGTDEQIETESESESEPEPEPAGSDDGAADADSDDSADSDE